MKYFIGIDPGIHTGAVAVVSEHLVLCHVEPLPSTDKDFSYKGTVELIKTLGRWHPEAIYVEHTFHGRGLRKRAHEFAMSAGAILQAMHFLAGERDIVSVVSSDRWRRTVGLKKDTLAKNETGWKVAANNECRRRWPERQWPVKIGPWNKGKQGLADASLIALAAAIDYRRAHQ